MCDMSRPSTLEFDRDLCQLQSKPLAAPTARGRPLRPSTRELPSGLCQAQARALGCTHSGVACCLRLLPGVLLGVDVTLVSPLHCDVFVWAGVEENSGVAHDLPLETVQTIVSPECVMIRETLFFIVIVIAV